MTEPTTEDIQERHDWIRDVTLLCEDGQIAHKDRGILLGRLEKAEQTIKEISELIAYYRDIDAENPDETIRMIAVADELQTILNRSKS